MATRLVSPYGISLSLTTLPLPTLGVSYTSSEHLLQILEVDMDAIRRKLVSGNN